MGKRFFLPFLLLAAAVSFLAPRLTGRGEKRIISPFVSTGELAKENQPFPAKRAASPLRAFKKVLGFRTSSSTSSIFPPPAAEGKRKTSLIREYLSKAADGLFGQVLGLKDEIALGPTSTPTATPSPTPGSAEVTATPIPTATPTSVPSLTPTPNPESELTADQQETKTVAAVAGEALVQKDYVSLYNLMVSDFRSTYSEEEFLGSIGQGQNIVGAQTVSEPEIFGANEEWGRVMLELAFSDGTTQRYLVITFREGEAWRIFGTEEVP